MKFRPLRAELFHAFRNFSNAPNYGDMGLQK